MARLIMLVRIAAYALLVTLTISLAWIERRIYDLFRLLEKGRNALGARPDDEMTPTWRETARTALMALALLLALALLMTLGSD